MVERDLNFMLWWHFGLKGLSRSSQMVRDFSNPPCYAITSTPSLSILAYPYRTRTGRPDKSPTLEKGIAWGNSSEIELLDFDFRYGDFTLCMFYFFCIAVQLMSILQTVMLALMSFAFSAWRNPTIARRLYMTVFNVTCCFPLRRKTRSCGRHSTGCWQAQLLWCLVK